MCLLSWWQTKRDTSCPTCRTISENPPVRDSVQGFVALARVQAGEADESDSFDADIFDTFFSESDQEQEGEQEGSSTDPIEID